MVLNGAPGEPGAPLCPSRGPQQNHLCIPFSEVPTGESLPLSGKGIHAPQRCLSPAGISPASVSGRFWPRAVNPSVQAAKRRVWTHTFPISCGNPVCSGTNISAPSGLFPHLQSRTGVVTRLSQERTPVRLRPDMHRCFQDVPEAGLVVPGPWLVLHKERPRAGEAKRNSFHRFLS